MDHLRTPLTGTLTPLLKMGPRIACHVLPYLSELRFAACGTLQPRLLGAGQLLLYALVLVSHAELLRAS